MTDRNEERRIDWSPAKLRYELEERGLTYRYLSQKAGYAQDSLKAVARTPNEAYEQIIADALGLAPEEIWPNRCEFRNRKRKCKAA